MAPILKCLAGREPVQFEAGAVILQQGETTGRLYVLVSGQVEVSKDGIGIARVSQPGAVFGDLSVFLRVPHTATVRAVAPCSFHCVDDPVEWLRSTPDASLHMCELLARRLDGLNRYLVDVKRQFEGHDHLRMVDEVLDTLLNRPPVERVRPRVSGP